MFALWNLFRSDCLVRGVQETSLSTYEDYIAPFLKNDPPIASKIDLFNYLREKYAKPFTRRKAWEHLRIFFKWAVENSHMEPWHRGFKIHAPRPDPPPVLTVDEFNRLLAAIPADTQRGLRDRALISLYFTTGARRNSILLLKWQDIDLGERWMYLRTMKGGKQAAKSIPEPAIEHVQLWRIVAPASDWAFPSLRFPERHLHKDAITHYIPRYALAAGFPPTRRIFTHLFRHSFATELARNDEPAESIMQCLDHSDIRMSLNYIRRSVFKQRAATDRVFGKINLDSHEHVG